MRLIETTNSHVVLKETHDVSGELISMQGYEYGALHYKISNGKIAFYLNDLDNPWKAEVWSVNMPVMVDGVLQDDDTIEAALASVMADKWQEQIDDIALDLDAESERAQAEEQRIEHQFDDRFEALYDKDAELEESINDEIDRAVSAETFIYNYASAVNASLTSEITRSVAEDARLNQAILDETARAVSAETRIEHQFDNRFAALDAEDARLNQAILDETSRATSAETTLNAAIASETFRAETIENVLSGAIDSIDSAVQGEITRATAKDAVHDTLISALTSDLLSEVARATSAETALNTAIGNEVTRATAKDAELDTLISSLTSDLSTEVTRATNAETALSTAISSEVTRATSAETALQTSLNGEVVRATTAEAALSDRISANTTAINAEATRAQIAENTLSTTKADKVDLVALSSNTYSKAEVNAALALKADKASAFTSVEYNHSDNRIYFKANGVVVGEVNTSDFVRDGMVSDVRISNGYLVITFNADSGHQTINIPLTDIFNPSNYYLKSETDLMLADKMDVSGMSAYATIAYVDGEIEDVTANTALQISSAVAPINANVSSISAATAVIEGKVNTLSGNVYTKAESDARFVDNSELSGYAYSKYDVDTRILSATSGKADTSSVNAISGAVQTLSGNTYTKVESDTKYQPQSGMTAYTLTSTTSALNNAITAHTYDGSIHVTSSDKSAWSGKQDALVSGSNIKTINNESILGSGNIVIASADAYTKQESDAKYQAQSGMSAYTLTSTTNSLSGVVTAHTANGNIHVTSGDKATWNAKQDSISDLASIRTSASTQSDWNASSGVAKILNKPTIPIIWSGTQAQFDLITTKDPNTIYLVTN